MVEVDSVLGVDRVEDLGGGGSCSSNLATYRCSVGSANEGGPEGNKDE